MILSDIPIFPLNTVLFPDGTQVLRIFEPRYTRMLSKCLRNSTPFGICLIREGEEVGAAASTYEMGTLVLVEDWNTGADNILVVQVRGTSRFRILDENVDEDQLLTADIETIEVEQSIEVQSSHLDLLERCQKQLNIELEFDPAQHDCTWLGFRLAEILPIRLAQKQYFLQLFDGIARLEGLSELLDQLDPNAIA